MSTPFGVSTGVATVHKWRLRNGEYIPVIIDDSGVEVEVTWAAQQGSQAAFLESSELEVLFAGTRAGCGKDLNPNTKILTDSGWKAARDVMLTDNLVAPDGSYTAVVGIYPKKNRPMNRLLFDDGAEIEADDEHQWSVYGQRGGVRGRSWQVRTTADIKKNFDVKWSIPLIDAPVPGKRWMGYDPYVVGVMIGDGTMSSAYPIVYTRESEIIDHLTKQGWRGYNYPQHRRGGVIQMTLPRGHDLLDGSVPRETGDSKYVPKDLLEADPVSRLAALQGLMDTDGHCEKDGNCRFTTISLQLAKDVQYLARSLGGKASIHTRKFKEGGYSPREFYFVVRITHAGKFIPFRLPRHIERLTLDQVGGKRRIVSITPCGEADGVCFAVAHPSKLFVVQDFIVTHNTDALLMSFAMDVGRGWGPSLKGIIVRQTHPMLKEVIAKSKRWFPRLFPGAFYNEIKFRWEFPAGETLVFDHLMDESDFRRYLGQEYTFIGFEELITWPDLKCYGLMFSCLRSSIPGIPRKIRSTTNPYGPSHNEIMQRFRINERKEGQILGPLIEGERDEQGHKLPSRRVIFGHIFENKLLMKVDPDYMDRLLAGAPSEALQKAWRDGDWNITAGGMFGDIWATHADYIQVKQFDVPENWIITRAYDHGSTAPFCCLWFAKSTGEDLTFPDGSTMRTKRGDLFIVGELYGANSKHEGLNLAPPEIVKRIIQYEFDRGWRTPERSRVRRGPADTGIWAETDGRPSIVNEMEKPVVVNGIKCRGIVWEQADKIKGSRKQGWELMRQKLAACAPVNGYREFAGLFVCMNCVNWIRTTPWLQRDEKDMDDVPENAEDHCAEATRFRLRYNEPASSLTRRVGAATPSPTYSGGPPASAAGAPPPGGYRIR